MGMQLTRQLETWTNFNSIWRRNRKVKTVTNLPGSSRQKKGTAPWMNQKPRFEAGAGNPE
jgi:hypothetical protein